MILHSVTAEPPPFFLLFFSVFLELDRPPLHARPRLAPSRVRRFIFREHGPIYTARILLFLAPFVGIHCSARLLAATHCCERSAAMAITSHLVRIRSLLVSMVAAASLPLAHRSADILAMTPWRLQLWSYLVPTAGKRLQGPCLSPVWRDQCPYAEQHLHRWGGHEAGSTACTSSRPSRALNSPPPPSPACI